MASRLATKDLRDDEIIRFLRFSITESAAATFTQQSYDTNLSIDRGIIWMIHWIEWDLNVAHIADDPAQGASESITGQVTREGKSALLQHDDSDLIAKTAVIWKHAATIGTEAGPMYALDTYPKIQHFPIPLPFANQTIYIAILSTAGAAQTSRGRLAYTLRRVTDKFFYRIAQALIS